jgi:hypothetical protein
MQSVRYLLLCSPGVTDPARYLQPRKRPNTAQIKTLDTVKMQVRALELRKASRELRMRDAHVAEREKDILEREAAVLAREQAVLSRENAIRSAQEAVKENEARLSAAWSAHRSQVAQQQMQSMQLQERENVRPVEPETMARVASRPSMVPRRPLGDDRRARCVVLLHSSPLFPFSPSLPRTATPVPAFPSLAFLPPPPLCLSTTPLRNKLLPPLLSAAVSPPSRCTTSPPVPPVPTTPPPAPSPPRTTTFVALRWLSNNSSSTSNTKRRSSRNSSNCTPSKDSKCTAPLLSRPCPPLSPRKISRPMPNCPSLLRLLTLAKCPPPLCPTLPHPRHLPNQLRQSSQPTPTTTTMSLRPT